MEKLTDLKIVFFSDSSYDRLVTEVYYKSYFFALINIDDGIENMKLEFPEIPSDENIIRSIPLDWVMQALSIAKEETIKRQKITEDQNPWSLTNSLP